MQYGIIVNGVLRKAPHRLTYDGCNSDSHSAEVYLRFGYKQIISAVPPSECPKGKELVSRWIEDDTQIVQVWELHDLPDDFAEIYRREKGRFTLAILALKRSIQEYVQRKEDEIERCFSDPILAAARECLKIKYPNQTIKEAMSHYEKSIPSNFFSEIGMIEALGSMGYVVNNGATLLVTKKGEFLPFKNDESVNLVDGSLYSAYTGEKLYLIPSFDAVKCMPDAEPIIIDPLFLALHLRDIAEIYDSAYGNSMQHNMTYCYLHTIMDEFLTNTLRFYMQAYPTGAGLEGNISVQDVVRLKTIEDLLTLQSECISKRISSLGHESYKEKLEYLKKRGIECACDKKLWFDDMIWFCEKRNALVHNSGIINRVNLSKLEGTCYQGTISEGTSILPSYNELVAEIELVDKVCTSLYQSMRAKFSI